MPAVRPIAREVPKSPAGLPSRELQELWFATRRRDWKSLVLVPATPGRSAYPLAKALGEVGGIVRMSPVQVVNAEGLDLPRIAALVESMTIASAASSVWVSSGVDKLGPAAAQTPASRQQDPAMIVVIEPVAQNPLALPVALASDAVLLVLDLGASLLDEARHTIELIGRDRLVGCVLVRPEK
jgi:hypothetical protein